MSEVFKVGDRVRAVGNIPEVFKGEIGTVAETHRLHTIWPISVDFNSAGNMPVALNEIELVEAAPVARVEDLMTPISDPVEHPNYYVLPNGRETIEISQWLTSAGGQAVQYIVRATRLDGIHKGERVQDIDKAIYRLNIERERLVSQGG